MGGFVIPYSNSGGSSIHGENAAHKERGNPSREVFDEDIFICNLGLEDSVLKCGDIVEEGGLPDTGLVFGHASGGQLVNGLSNEVMVFEGDFKIFDIVVKG